MTLQFPTQRHMTFLRAARTPAWGVLVALAACVGASEPGSERAGIDGGSEGSAYTEGLAKTCVRWVGEQRATDIRELAPAENGQMRDNLLVSGGGIRKIGNTYYTVWFPSSWYSQPVRRIMFTLHGTGGAPEYEWNDWRAHLGARHWGFIGLNYLIDATAGDAGYLEPDALYTLLREILREMNAPCAVDSAAISLMGWSRGSIHGIRMMTIDRANERRLLGHLANSAAWGTNDAALPSELAAIRDSGDSKALSGANFWMYCGEQDLDAQGISRCVGMEHAKGFLERYGAHVETLYRNPGPGADHHSMPGTQAAVEQSLTYLESLR